MSKFEEIRSNLNNLASEIRQNRRDHKALMREKGIKTGYLIHTKT